MGTICFPFTDDSDPERKHGRKRLKTPIPINSAFLKGYNHKKIVSAYIACITLPNNIEDPPDAVSQLCTSYYSDTMNFAIQLKENKDTDASIVDSSKKDKQIYNVRQFQYSLNGSTGFWKHSTEADFIYLFSQEKHVDKPLKVGDIRSCGVYFESYCHELGIHIKKYQQRRILGKSEWATNFNDTLEVAFIPKKDGIAKIYDKVTWSLYADIHYLGYTEIPDGSNDDKKEDEPLLVSVPRPDDIYFDIRLSSNIEYEWKIEGKALKDMKKCISSSQFCSDNFGLNGNVAASEQYGFCICYIPKKTDDFFAKYEGESGDLKLMALGKPMNVGELVCEIKMDTDLTWNMSENEEEEDIVEYKWKNDDDGFDFKFSWEYNGEFDNFADRGTPKIGNIPSLCLENRESVTIKVSITIKQVFDMKRKEIEKSQWHTVGILCDT